MIFSESNSGTNMIFSQLNLEAFTLVVCFGLFVLWCKHGRSIWLDLPCLLQSNQPSSNTSLLDVLNLTTDCIDLRISLAYDEDERGDRSFRFILVFWLKTVYPSFSL